MRLMLVDDHVVFRQGLRGLLVQDPMIEVVAEAGSARDGYKALETAQPDLAVIDVALPGVNGIAAAREIVRRRRGCRVLMLSAHGDGPFVAESFGAGALGYVTKEQPIEEILGAIHRVARGESYVPPGFDTEVLRHQGRRYRRSGGFGPMVVLSVREREVFDLVVSGHPNREIAQELCISIKTVDTHRTRINRKLGLHSTTDLVRFAALNGLITA